MDMGLVVIIAIVAALVGIFLGFIISKATSKSSNTGNLKNQMDSLQERFTSYQSEVANHFNTTATLANKLSQDYQDIQRHLSHSVESLVADEELRATLLASIQAPVKALDYTPEPKLDNPSETNIPTIHSYIPKDYAPKTPGEVGTLAEEFGAKHNA